MMQTTVRPDVDFSLGAHIVTPRRWYTHHGIYVGAGQVVHYQGLSSSLRRGRIAKVSLAEFAGGRTVHVHDEFEAVFADIEIVARACSRLGEGAYDVLRNNCEHFCCWCAVGVARSSQVERLLSNPRALSFAARLLSALFNGWASTRDALPAIN